MISLETTPNEPGPSGPNALHTPTHSAHPSLSSSTRSYAPVLINPTSSNDSPSPTSAPPFLTLKYPYPLPIASLLDLAYTIHYQYNLSSQNWTWRSNGHLVFGAIARSVVLIGAVGCSKRWRSRGGFVAAICGICVGGGIWTDCAERLGAGGAGGGHEKKQGRQSWFLYMTILICISEYLLYLLLLRLSPPTHRGSSNPFSLRRPLPPLQTDVPFHFDSEDLEYTPRSVRYRRYSRRSGKGPGTGLFEPPPSTMAGPSRLRRESHSNHSDPILSDGDHAGSDQEEESDEEEQEGDGEEDTESNFSSFSESSIIDLPPPRSPHRIIPPSLSMNSGLNLGGQPIIGGIVRRTRSARYLGMSRSWGSAVERMEEGVLGQRLEGTEMGSAGSVEGYGTFQGRA